MRNQTEHKPFIFNEKFDKELLFSLYEDDFPYMEEIFSITLTQLKPDILQLKAAFEAGITDDIRKSIHKIKPSYGFVGLPAVQELCKQFESECTVAAVANELSPSYQKLIGILDESTNIIESEYQKFKEYNQP